MNLNGQSRAEYLRHVELIDLQLDFFQKRGLVNPKTKKGDSKSGSGTNSSNEDSSSSDQVSMTPP